MSRSQTLPASLWKRTLVSFLRGGKKGDVTPSMFDMRMYVSMFVADSLFEMLYQK